MHSRDVFDLIDDVYSAALAPEEFDRFLESWGRYVEHQGLDGSADPDASGDSVLTHIERAREIVEHIRIDTGGEAKARDFIDRQGHPAWLVSENGRILELNSAADDLVGRQRGRIWDLADASQMQRSLADALRRVSSHRADTPESEFLTCMVRPISRPVLFALSAVLDPLIGEERVVLVRASVSGWSDRMDGILARSFGLTEAEIQVCRQLSAGKTIAETAKTRLRSEQTVRAQVKSIYAKLGVVSQSELARLVTNLLFLATDHGRASGADNRVAGDARNRSCDLPDGRRLAYRLRGDPNGRPFVFVHGMLLGHPILPALDRALADAGWCMVCVDRPGYGGSDPAPDWRRGVEIFAADLPVLTRLLGSRPVPVVSHTSGVLSACAAAALNPGLVSGILAVAAGVPIVRRDMIKRYPERIRIAALTARHAPRALRFILTAGVRKFSRDGDEQVVRKNYEGSPVDYAALADPAILQLVRTGHAMTAESGFDGFCGDAVRIWGDWSDYVARAGCPITYLQGAADPICPADWADDLAARYDHVGHVTIPDAGQLLHHTHWRRFLAELTAFLRTTV